MVSRQRLPDPGEALGIWARTAADGRLHQRVQVRGRQAGLSCPNFSGKAFIANHLK